MIEPRSREARYLWFAPHAGLWPSFRIEHRLADALALSGRPVTMIHCSGVLDSYCAVMSADRLTVDAPSRLKRRTCRDCRQATRITRSRASYRVVMLDDYVDPKARLAADELAMSVTRGDWMQFEFDGLPLGRNASYLSMLHHKVADVGETDAAWSEYLSDLRNSLLVAQAMPRLLDEFDPTHAVVYNPLYPTTRTFADSTARRGAQLVSIQAGSYIPERYETVGVYHHISASQTLVDSPTITGALAVPCTPLEVRRVGLHLRHLIAGTDPWVYSTAPTRRPLVDIRSTLGLRADSPVIVAVLSSPDETRASEMVGAEVSRGFGRGYSTIKDFIRAIRALAESAPDLDIVIRLHPRLGANKRETVVSPDLADLLGALDALPANAHVNAPGDGISLYDLVALSSAVVNQSSSSGLEFLAFGVPLVVFDPLRHNIFPASFGLVPDALHGEALLDRVRLALDSGWSLEHCRNAFRWYATVHQRDLLLLRPPEAVDDSAKDQADEPATAEPAQPMVRSQASELSPALRRLVPVGVRDFGARALARRARVDTLPERETDSGWLAEWLMRVDATHGFDPIWRPPIIIRGEPDPDREDAEILSEVRGLAHLLGFDTAEGLGVVAAILDAPEASR